MKTTIHRLFAWLLVLAMVCSILPTVAFAEDPTTSTWSKVAFADIKASDTVAITMSKNGTTYALPTAGNGGDGQPLAVTASVNSGVLTLDGDSSAFGWSISATEGGWLLHCDAGYLCAEDTNDGVRIGETGAVWTLIDDGYFSTQVTEDTVRYLGVYAGSAPDWRCYKAHATGNISGETLEFWVYDPSATPTPDPDPNPDPEPNPDPDPNPDPEPNPDPGPSDQVQAELLTELKDGDKVYIYNPKSAKVLTDTVSGTQLAGTDAVVENSQLTVTEDMTELSVSVDANGYYIFRNAAGEYLTADEATPNVLSFAAAASDYSLWELEEVEGGFYVKSVNGAKDGKQFYLECYKNNFTTYTFTSYNAKPFLLQFFTTGAGGFTDTIAAGDRVILYNPTYSMGLSDTILDTDKGQDLAGTELALSADGKLSGYTAANIWTVSVNEDGTYGFANADGLKLSVISRTHVGLSGDVNAWTLSAVEGKTGEYYLRSSVGSCLEWYADKGYWSAYYNPTEAMYAVRFYLVSGSVQPSNVVAAPKAVPKAGEVDSGTEISFTCATEGATILYKIGTGEWIEYTAPIAITEDTTFTVKAVKEGMEDSAEVVFAYTIYIPPVLGDDQATLVTDIAALAAGDRILIVTSGSLNYALGTAQKPNNRGTADVIKAYDKLSYDENAQILTLESGVEEGTYALYAVNGENQGYLYASTESGNLLRTQDGKDINASFTITIAADGKADIVSKADKKANIIRYNTVGIFSCYGSGQQPVSIYKLDDNMVRPGLPAEGDEVVIYNLSAKGVLSGMEGDLSDVYGCSVKAAGAEIQGDKAICANGALLFKVEKNGEYYRFRNASFGYLCSTGTGNNTFYTTEASEDADWTLTAYNGGYTMGSRTAAFEGKTQYLQYYSGSFTTWGMYAVTDRDVFTYHFFPCGSDKITDGVVNEPQAVFGNLAPAYAGQKYTLHFTVDALFGVKELKVFLGETELTCTLSGERYTAIIPAELISGETLTVTVRGVDNKDVPIETTVDIAVKDEPVISQVSPAANTQTKENKRPVISAVLTNVGEAPAIVMTVNDETVNAVFEGGKLTYQPATDMADGRVTVTVTVTRADGKTASKSWSFTVGESSYSLYFGQLHSHNGEYSDGAGTLSGALEYIAGLPEDANVDFVAFTDHSNYFDKSGEANPEDALFDLDQATEYSRERWTTYKNTIAEFNASHSDVLAIPGFEMTWSGGPGHMNTFVTEGIVSRNNTTLNNKSGDAGLQTYYKLLSRDEGVNSISQFNHPGGTFGNFVDFSYWSATADERIYLVEVGNGEGQVGASGYYPSYEQYTLALDKGWHLAPTNNQDNHKGKWGNANDARDVVLAESFTEEGIYDAIRNYRVYSTEDKNLELLYTVNDLPMGTIIESVPEKLKFDVSVMDPDNTDSIAKVELIGNSGKVAYTWDDPAELAKGVLTAELRPDYTYYYVRVTEADGDLAVTAPVWVGQNLKLGIDKMEADSATPLTGEELTITTTLHNGESYDAIVKSVVYTTNGSEVLAVDNNTYTLAADSTLALTWVYTPKAAKLTTITATVVVEMDGKEYTFTASVELDVLDASQLAYIGIDASHGNEYVAGYNKNLMNNFITLANGCGIRVELLTTSEALVAACGNEKYAAIVLNVPSRRLSEAKDYTDAELTALAAFHAGGGALIVTGAGDSSDKTEPHMAATQNRLLAALGSSLRLSDDGTYEDTAFALSLNAYGENALTEGLTGSISYYGGSSIYAVDKDGNVLTTLPDAVSAVLFANGATVSKDSDGDGLGGDATPKYTFAQDDERLLVMAMEKTEGKGLLLVAGAAFMNDYDLKLPAENANNALCENLFNAVRPVHISTVAEVRAQSEEGFKFTIEGVVTSNASGYDKETAFFDCIYVQDATGGINCFPVAGEFKLGDIVRVTGTTDSYQGEPELQVTEIEKVGETAPVQPVEITAAQLNDRSAEGKLVTLKGTVTAITMANGLVESIYVKDASGAVARVFIDGYITASKTIEGLKVGCTVEATGLASYDDTYAIENDSYARLRVRDRAEILCVACAHAETELRGAKAATCTEDGYTGDTYCKLCGEKLAEGSVIAALGHHYDNGVCTVCGEKEPIMVCPFTDIKEDDWFYAYVLKVYAAGVVNGYTKTEYAPELKLTRGQMVTMLYRAMGEPEVSGYSTFTDVPKDAYYAKAVAWAEREGVVNGATPTTFEPEENVTREQMVTMFYRLEGKEAVSGDLTQFKDHKSVSAYAVDAMQWAVGKGIINGTTFDGDSALYLDPQGLTTRAQAAKVFCVWMELYLK